jgi:penicillin-binding protein 2
MVLSRVYPFGPDFAHQVGYVGPVSDSDLDNGGLTMRRCCACRTDQIGKTGVERIHERALRGEPGTRQRVEVNVPARTMRELASRSATPGPDMQITLDHHLQNFMRVRLEGQSAAAIVMDVTNGDLLGCTSAPSFDPNLFVRGISSKDYGGCATASFARLPTRPCRGPIRRDPRSRCRMRSPLWKAG